MTSQQHFKYLLSENYKGNFKVNDKNLKCYTKKQVHSLYAKKDYKILGEYSKKNSLNNKNCIGYVSIDNDRLPIYKYKNYNRLIYSEVSYIQCNTDDISFVVLLKNRLFIRIVILSLILIALFLSSFFIFLGKAPKNNPIDIDKNITDWFPHNNIEQPKPSSGVQLFGFGSLTIPSNTKEIDMSLGNCETNSCYLKIIIQLEDGTELFHSDLVPPGKGFNHITLNKTLPSGTYDAIIKYETYNLETGEANNSAKLKFILNVH